MSTKYWKTGAHVPVGIYCTIVQNHLNDKSLVEIETMKHKIENQ